MTKVMVNNRHHTGAVTRHTRPKSRSLPLGLSWHSSPHRLPQVGHEDHQHGQPYHRQQGPRHPLHDAQERLDLVLLDTGGRQLQHSPWCSVQDQGPRHNFQFCNAMLLLA